MTLFGVLAMGRASAESRMTQTWCVGTVTETTVPGTYDVAKVLDDVAYEGPARFKPEGTSPQVREVAGQVVTVQEPELHLPAGTSGVEVGMYAVCVACPEDASLVGTAVRVVSRATRGQVTAARFRVDLTGEEIEVGS